MLNQVRYDTVPCHCELTPQSLPSNHDYFESHEKVPSHFKHGSNAHEILNLGQHHISPSA